MSTVADLLREDQMPNLAALYDAIAQNDYRETLLLASNSLNPHGYVDLDKTILEIKKIMAKHHDIAPPAYSHFDFGGLRFDESTNKAISVNCLEYIKNLQKVLHLLSESTKKDLERLAEAFIPTIGLDPDQCRNVDLDT